MKRLFALMTAIFLLSSITTSAKAAPDYFIVDAQDMFPMILHLDTALIFDQTAEINPAPEINTEPYILRAYIRLDNGELIESEMSPFHYYPEQGQVFFVGNMVDGTRNTSVANAASPFEGRWYPVRAELALIIDEYIATGQFVQRELLQLQHSLSGAMR